MHKIIALSLLITITINGFTQKIKVAIVHLTAAQIENYVSLFKNEIIPIKEFEITGVYYEKENYDYQKAEKIITDSNYTFIHLEKITGELNLQNIFTYNPCSDQFTRIFNQADAILFNGGPDIPPVIYNENAQLLTLVEDPFRNYFEISFLFHLLGSNRNPDFKPLLLQKPNMPVWAFCLGMQSMNVATGGTLVQDIPSEIYHYSTVEEILQSDTLNRHRDYRVDLNPELNLEGAYYHQIILKTDSKLEKPFLLVKGFKPLVYSYHHQAVEKPGQNIVIEATSPDGKIPEIISNARFPNVIAFQFHPENSDLYKFTLPGNKVSKNNSIFTLDAQSLEFHKNIWRYFAALLSNK